MKTKVDVRDPGGSLLGTLELYDATLLREREVVFARALNVRYYGAGLRELLPVDRDMSFQTVRLKVQTWITPPAIGKYGGYQPGRVDWIFEHNGLWDELMGISGFQPA